LQLDHGDPSFTFPFPFSYSFSCPFSYSFSFPFSYSFSFPFSYSFASIQFNQFNWLAASSDCKLLHD